MFATITQARRAAYTSIIVAVIGVAAAWTFAVRTPAFADGCSASTGPRVSGTLSTSLHASTAASVAKKSAANPCKGRATGHEASSRSSTNSLISVAARVSAGQGESTEGSLVKVSAPAKTPCATSGSHGPLIFVGVRVSANQGIPALKGIEGLLGL